MKIILASQSKFRQELLNKLSLKFESIPANIDEDKWKAEISAPQKLAIELSYQKASYIKQSYPDALIIGSDQVCFCEDVFYSKAYKHRKALKQLSELSGKTHQLYSAYTLLYQDQRVDYCDITSLTMKSLSDEQLDRYLKHDEPYWCAGSYKLEELGIALFDKIQTQDSTAIIGLPLIQLIKDLEKLGVQIL